MQSPTVDEYVAQYVKLRDYVKAKEEELKPYTEAMDLIAAQLGQKMRDNGVESFKTEHGTAYKTQTLSVKTADKDAFVRYCIGEEKWDLVDFRPAKSGVEEFMAQNNDTPPPGVDVALVTNVRVRRS
jgi:hypothetical protein